MKEIIRRFLSVNWFSSLFINFYYFGFKGCFCFPLLFGYGVKINSLGSRRSLKFKNSDKLSFASLCFALKGGPYNMGNANSLWNIEDGASIMLCGICRFSKGTILSVLKDGSLTIGDKFSSNANLYLQCSKKISIGEDVLLGWNVSIMDSDGGHQIFDRKTRKIENPDKEIQIGNHVWLGEGSTVMKGTSIPNGCILASKAVASRFYSQENSVIAGIPGSVIKNNVEWNH